MKHIERCKQCYKAFETKTAGSFLQFCGIDCKRTYKLIYTRKYKAEKVKLDPDFRHKEYLKYRDFHLKYENDKYHKNHAKSRKLAKKYYKNNRENVLQYIRKWREKNREKHLQYQREYQRERYKKQKASKN